MEKFEVIVYCGAKCGGTTLAKTFQNNGYKTLHMHGEKSPGMFSCSVKLNSTIYDVVDNSCKSNKVYIIDSYRTPIERKISAFFQQINNKIDEYENLHIDELIKIFNEKHLNQENYHPLNDIMAHYDLNNFENFDSDRGYNIIEKDNKVFIKIRFDDINNWSDILSKIMGKNITMHPDNLTKHKKSATLYNTFKNKYKPPKSYIDNVRKDDEFKIYNNYKKNAEYIYKWFNISYKTLIGKNGYLFLQNDSGQELKTHCENLCLVKDINLTRYIPYKDKYILVIFPDKCCICKDFLPDGFHPNYRPSFDVYKNFFKNNIIDGHDLCKNMEDIYYKTDSHMNLKGTYAIYCYFIEKINLLCALNIEKRKLIIKKTEVSSLIQLGNGLGDLLWESNLRNQTVLSNSDNFYYCDELDEIYLKYKISDNSSFRIMSLENKTIIDKTINYIGNFITWPILSSHLIYKNNEGKQNSKCLIFHDSFLLSTLSLYLELFEHVYLSKSAFNKNLIDVINPDYIFEFRIERFLI